MIITNIGDLKNVFDLTNEGNKRLYDRACFLYELLEHYGDNITDINIDLEAASILYLDFHADINTVIATMIYRIVQKLHIPDTEILRLFNEDIKTEVNMLIKFDEKLDSVSNNNHLQMIKSLTRDVRVAVIKLVERSTTFNHMKKREFTNKKEFVNDTLNFYVPISKLLGIYKIKNRLEDACFKYNHNFNAASDIVKMANDEYNTIIGDINKLIESENIGLSELPEFKINKKSAYDIFRKANEIETKVKILKKEENINLLGFCSVKCLLDNREDCYRVIYLLHKFKPVLGSFNDYIGGSQGNEYHAIHTSVFIKGHVVDFRICTKGMDYVNYYGITSSWKDNKDLQNRFMNNYDFYSELLSLEKSLPDEELEKAFEKNILEAKELKGEYIALDLQKFLKEEDAKVSLHKK